MNCIPNLFIPGAAKSGTSSLHEYLNQHPDINMSSSKEPHFFCDDRTEEEWSKYLDMFDDSYQYNGESSTGYMVFDKVIERIVKSSPDTSDIKFIFILRNPIDRLISHYNWLNGQGWENKKIMDALYFDFKTEPKYHVHPGGIGYKNYYHWGLYYKYLKEYYKYFSPNQILLITTESLKENPQGTLDECMGFLKLERYEFDLSTKSNQSLEVKNKRLSYFFNTLNSQNKVIITVSKIIPKKAFEMLKVYKLKIIALLGKNTSVKKTTYDNSIRNELHKHYVDDVEKLKILTGKNFNEWTEFATD